MELMKNIYFHLYILNDPRKTYRDTNLHEILTIVPVLETNEMVQERWHAPVKDHGLGSQASDQLF